MSSEGNQDAVSGSTILRVYNYEPGTKSIKQKKTLEMPSGQDLTKITLRFMRGLLVQKKVFDSPEYGPRYLEYRTYCPNLPFL